MERVVSCYLPPSCCSPPLSKLSVGSWGSIPFHLLKSGSQPWTSTALTSTGSIQNKFYCCFSASEPQLMDWSIWEYLASSSLDSAWGERQQQGSQVPLFSMHILYAEIVLQEVVQTENKKSLLQDAGKEYCSLYWHVGKEIFFFFCPFSHQHFHIGNSSYNRMLARLTQATSILKILKLPFILLAWQ